MAGQPPDEGTPYAPSPPPPNAGVCSWCGRRQSDELLVLMSGDGRAGICEECLQTHARFFARRRAERDRPPGS
jgi:hypothetical protein